MRDPDQGHCRAVGQSDRRAAAADRRSRHDMVDSGGILAGEGDAIAVRLAEPDDSILTSDATVLDQGSTTADGNQIVSGAAIDRLGAAAPDDRVVCPASDNPI